MPNTFRPFHHDLPHGGRPVPRFGPIHLSPSGRPTIGIHYLPAMNAMLPPSVGLVSDTDHGSALLRADLPHADALPREFSWVSVGGLTASTDAMISSPPNQGTCGSCWAVSSTTVLADRWAIATKQPSRALAVEAVCTCAAAQFGGDRPGGCCDGGMPDWCGKFFETTGVPQDACFPYACSPAADGPCTSQMCTGAMKDAGQPCAAAGVRRVATPYKALQGTTKLLTKAEGHDEDTVRENIERIKVDIMAHGPAPTCMWVYKTFQKGKAFSPDTGDVYVDNGTEKPLGGHALVVVGWGVEKLPANSKYGAEMPYWLIRNSWGTHWGLDGYVKVAMGVGGLNSRVGIDHVVNGLGGTFTWLADPESGPPLADRVAPVVPHGGDGKPPTNQTNVMAKIIVGSVYAVSAVVVALVFVGLRAFFRKRKQAATTLRATKKVTFRR